MSDGSGASFALNGKKSLWAELRPSESGELLLDELAQRAVQPLGNAEPSSRRITTLACKLTGIGRLAEEGIARRAVAEERRQLVPVRVPLVACANVGCRQLPFNATLGRRGALV